MVRYFAGRLLYMLPVMIVITLLAFIISQLAPGDPADRIVQTQTISGTGRLAEQRESNKQLWRKKLGLDLPVFYFSLQSLAEPDTLHKIYPSEKRHAIERLISRYGNWPEIQAWQMEILAFERQVMEVENKIKISANEFQLVRDALNEIRFELATLKSQFADEQIANRLGNISGIIQKDSTFMELVPGQERLKTSFMRMKQFASPYLNYIPCVRFHTNNQYHRWIFGDATTSMGDRAMSSKGLIRGDFGTSYLTGLPVLKQLINPLKWSLLLSLLAVLVAYLAGVPAGIKAAANRNGLFDKVSSNIFFMLFSLPVFWVATLLLMLFANPGMFKWFPASGIMPVMGYPPGAGLAEKIILTAPYLFLPLICYSYGLIAYLGRTVRITMISELGQAYIQTARAKGLERRDIISRHAFRNSTLPLITTLAGAFPAVIGGSVIIETIFSVPGMGLETVFAIQHQNYPVIVAIFMLTGFLTMVGYLIGDLLYAFADPRISFKSSV